ncbi:MAG TPA: YgiQ family radical SAM protein, partial [Verrucomicrobiota bacterium]|nr:YgiQ family radical SAM protein [Verrucomicrobiota bacterium]
KVAPEHLHPDVLRRMRKPAVDFETFLKQFHRSSEAAGKEQYLVPYFISSFPGCTDKEMAVIERFLKRQNWNLQQVQDFIPLPMTGAAAMYVTGLDLDTEQPIPVVRNAGDRARQQRLLRPNRPRATPRGVSSLDDYDAGVSP